MHPKSEAIKLLQELGIKELPIDPIKIIEILGISRMEHKLKSIEGFSGNYKNQFFIGVNSAIKDKRRKNFTYAHELGHLCLHAFNQTGNSCQKQDINNNLTGSKQTEINANVFASHLLLPEFLIKDKIKNLDPSWEEISNLAKMTETSLITMASRFVEMTDHSCLLAVISQNKRIKYFRKSCHWRLYFDMDSRLLHSRSYAYKSCNRENIPDDFASVPAGIWLSDKRIFSASKILEWSLPLNAYGDVLTLLWDEEDLSEKNENEIISPFYNKNKLGGVWDPPTFHKSKRKS